MSAGPLPRRARIFLNGDRESDAVPAWRALVWPPATSQRAAAFAGRAGACVLALVWPRRASRGAAAFSAWAACCSALVWPPRALLRCSCLRGSRRVRWRWSGRGLLGCSRLLGRRVRWRWSGRRILSTSRLYASRVRCRWSGRRLLGCSLRFGMRVGWRWSGRGLLGRSRLIGRFCRGGSRLANIRLCSRRGLGVHGAMLQIRYAGYGTGHRGMGGNPLIHRSKIGLVLFCYLFMLPLCRSRLKVRLACEACLLRGRPRGYAVRPAIETGVIVIDDRRVVDHRGVHIRGPNDGRVYANCRCVVSKLTTAPLAAAESASTVTKSIIHAAVEADLRAPVTAIENIIAAVPISPIARRPEIARLRSLHPCSRNPVVVALAVPGPIAWSPHVVGLRTGRLFVNRNTGWSEIDAYAELRQAARGEQDECSCKESCTEGTQTEGVHPKPPVSHIRAWF